MIFPFLHAHPEISNGRKGIPETDLFMDWEGGAFPVLRNLSHRVAFGVRLKVIKAGTPGSG
jgi:hypothetical protein